MEALPLPDPISHYVNFVFQYVRLFYHTIRDGRQVAQSVDRRTLEVEARGSKPNGGVRFHLTSTIRRALRRRRPHYSQSGDLQFPGKRLSEHSTAGVIYALLGNISLCGVYRSFQGLKKSRTKKATNKQKTNQ